MTRYKAKESAEATDYEAMIDRIYQYLNETVGARYLM
jgi:hypothetical protein